MANSKATQAANALPRSRFAQIVDFWFTVDLRSAGLLRILLGLVLISYWFDCWRWMDRLYSADGVLPARALAELRQMQSTLGLFTPLEWLEGSPWALHAFFLAALACFLAFLVGYRTRLFGLLSLLAVAAIVQRNPYCLIGANFVLGSLLLWAQFLPLGRRFSIDALRAGIARGVPLPTQPATDELRPMVPGERRSPRLVAALGIVLQIGLIYFCTAAWKIVPLLWGESLSWWSGTAIHYVLHMEQSIYAPALWVREAPLWFIRLLSWGTLAAEATALPLLLLPWAQPYLRRVALGLLIPLHLGIAVTLDAGLFSYVMLASFAILLTEADWALLQRVLARYSRPATVYYDDGCGVCARTCEILALCDRFGRLSFIGSSDLASRRNEIPPGLTEKTVVVFDDRSGRMVTHTAAMAAALRGLPLPFHVLRLIALPGIVHLANLGYKLFARNRHHASRWLGLTACQVPQRAARKGPPAPAQAEARTWARDGGQSRPPRHAAAPTHETLSSAFFRPTRLALVNAAATVALVAVLASNGCENGLRLAFSWDDARQLAAVLAREPLEKAADAPLGRGMPFLRFLVDCNGRYNVIVNYTGALQRWNMFAPDPPDFDHWWVVDAQREDGQRIDPLTGAMPDFITQPSHGERRYPRAWTAYLQYGPSDLRYERHHVAEVLRRELCRYLVENYNRKAEEGTKIVWLDVHYIRLAMPLPADKVVPAGAEAVIAVSRRSDSYRHGFLLGSYDVSEPRKMEPFESPTSGRGSRLIRRTTWYPSGKAYRDGLHNLDLHTDEGLWNERRPSGAKQNGPMLRGRAHGVWQHYHAEGWLQQEGRWEHGVRQGEWRHYYPPKDRGDDGAIGTGKTIGSVQEKFVLVDGQRHGPASVWYRDGTLKERGEYERDGRCGTWTKFRSDGSKEMQGAYKGGVMEGAWDFWHRNGAQAGRKTYQQGVLNGPWFEYYPDGKTLFQEGTMLADRPQGQWKKFHPNGQLEETGEYEQGLKTGLWKVFFETPAGTPPRVQAEETYRRGKLGGLYVEYRDNGQLARRGTFVDGLRQGMWEHWHANGKLSRRGQYQDDLHHGPWTIWNENGVEQAEGAYRAGNPHGHWTEWYADGRTVRASGAYADGAEHGPWTFNYKSGRPQKQGRYEHGQETGPWTFWNEDGKKSSEGQFSAGRKTGPWSTWTNGKELVETYRDGVVVEEETGKSSTP
jgi:antitoxin component YwqK of YwqJK toxin-antitoxin module/predicted DCC family thiol-disulfide oxidoreductase YuxK